MLCAGPSGGESSGFLIPSSLISFGAGILFLPRPRIYRTPTRGHCSESDSGVRMKAVQTIRSQR